MTDFANSNEAAVIPPSTALMANGFSCGDLSVESLNGVLRELFKQLDVVAAESWPQRTEEAFASLHAKPDGTIYSIAGRHYIKLSTVPVTESCAWDFAIDGITYAGVPSLAHFGIVANSPANQAAGLTVAVAACQGQLLTIAPGNYTFNSIPEASLLKNVYFDGDPRVSFTAKALPVASKILTGGVETCLIACVLRYYEAGEATDYKGRSTAGYYLIADKAGARHEPVLVAGVSASGSAKIVIESLLSALGLDPNDWTPAALNVTSDEGNTRSGILWGGSVGTQFTDIVGAFAMDRQSLVYYDAGSWKGTNAPYIFSGNTTYPLAVPQWLGSEGNEILRLYRNPTGMRGGLAPAGQQVVLGAYSRAGKIPALAFFESSSSVTLGGTSFSYIDVKFFALDGARIGVPTDSCAFSISDSAMQPNGVTTNINPGTGKNIWVFGAFRRKPQGYIV